MNSAKAKIYLGLSVADAMDSKDDVTIDYGTALADLEKKFIAEAKKIGRKYHCFDEAIRDDNALYIQLRPAMDFSKNYPESPTLQAGVSEFRKFRKELDDLAEKIGCCKLQYTCDIILDGSRRPDLNYLYTRVKESVWKKAGRKAANNRSAAS